MRVWLGIVVRVPSLVVFGMLEAWEIGPLRAA